MSDSQAERYDKIYSHHCCRVIALLRWVEIEFDRYTRIASALPDTEQLRGKIKELEMVQGQLNTVYWILSGMSDVDIDKRVEAEIWERFKDEGNSNDYAIDPMASLNVGIDANGKTEGESNV